MSKVDDRSMTPEQRMMFEQAKAKFRTPEAQARELTDRQNFQATKPGLEHPDVEPILGEAERLSFVSEAVEALRVARELDGLTVAELSERSGIERSAVHKLETGRQTNPTIGTLTRYATALGLELHVTLLPCRTQEKA